MPQFPIFSPCIRAGYSLEADGPEAVVVWREADGTIGPRLHRWMYGSNRVEWGQIVRDVNAGSAQVQRNDVGECMTFNGKATNADNLTIPSIP